ncbi:unnamed protein product, partial [Gordionus sp. m RMFG-2023]
KSGKWTNEEIDMLKNSIQTFANDLERISEHIKNKTISQIRQTLKKKAYEEAGIPENAKILSSENNLELNNQQIVISNIDTQSSLVATTLNEDDIVGSNLNESMASKFEINVKQENILLNSDN